MRKIKLIRLVVLTTAWLVGSSTFAWDEPTQIDGVYQIGTLSELEWFAEQVNSGSTSLNAQLTADVNCDQAVNYAPIGNLGSPYMGTFDGQGHRILNRNVDTGSNNEAGFFGRLYGGAVIKNLILDSTCSFVGNHVVGAFSGAMTGGNTIVFENCVNEAPVTATASNGASAAFVGACQGTATAIKVTNSANTGTITCGVSGRATVFCSYVNASTSSSFTNCYNTGALSQLNVNSQNFVQWSNATPVINNCYELSGVENATQGIIRTSDIVTTGELCYLLNGDQTSISFYQVVGSGKPMPFEVEGGQVYAHGKVNCDGSSDEGTTYDNQGPDGVIYLDHEYVNGICLHDCNAKFQPAEQDEEGFWMLANAGNVEWFSRQVHAQPGVYTKARLIADIDFTDVVHMPIGYDGSDKFRGTFDGEGHRITNMVSFTRGDGVGFFGATRGESTTIKNLIIDKSCYFTGSIYVGSIVGDMEYPPGPKYTTLENCINEADVVATGSQVGGLIGGCRYNDGTAYIINCVNRGNVSGVSQVGAFIGQTAGTSIIISSYNEGMVLEGQSGDRNLVGNGNATFDGVVDVSEMENRGQGILLSPEDKANGALCYNLNGDQSVIRWTQTIGVDSEPVLGTSSQQVYGHGRLHCNGSVYPNMTYNNNPNVDVIQDDHDYESGICTFCSVVDHEYLQPDEQGIYHFSTPGHIEWFSRMVNTERFGGIKAVLDDDIDFEGVENAHTPIGNDTYKFYGQFDGRGHHIKGMILNLENISSNGAGFFGSIRGGGTDANGIEYNDTVIIRNLYIDDDCEVIVAGNNIGGVVGRVNARNSDSNIVLIENCGNSANVTSLTAGGAAGVLGCVQSTTLGLIIRNCYNTGYISGVGECATICAWTGTAAEGLVKRFENCWNSGELTNGIEGDRNLFRTPNIEAMSSCYDCNPYNFEVGGKQGYYDWQTDDPVRSGELTYALGLGKKVPVWYQNLSEDDFPVLDPTHGYVYNINGDIGDVRDEESFLYYRDDLIEYETELMQEKVAESNLTESYLSYMTVLGECTTLESFLNIYYGDELNAIRQQIVVSEDAYKDYTQHVEEIVAFIEENSTLSGPDFDILQAYLNDDMEPSEQYPNGTYKYIISTHQLNVEELQEETGFLQALYDQALRNSSSAGTDVSNLIVNANFADGTNGWEVTGSVTTGGRADVLSVAQALNSSFDIHQTIEGLQNGLYEIICNGLFSAEPRDGNNNIVGYMYADNVRVYLPNIFDDYTLKDEAEDLVNCYITPGQSATDMMIYDYGTPLGYGPISLVGCSYHFKDGRYENHLLAEVTNGQLTIGIANPGSGNANDWTAFTNFRLIYRGQGESANEAADITLQGMAARSETLIKFAEEVGDYYLCPNFSAELLEGLKNAINSVVAVQTIDEKLELINRFSQLFADIYESRMAYREYADELEYFSEKITSLYSSGAMTDEQYEESFDLYDEIYYNIFVGTYTTEEALQKTDLVASPFYDIIFGTEPEQDADGWYLIANGQNVEWFSQYVARKNTSAKAKLTCDIDMEGIHHSPIGVSNERKFNGQFDGQYHRILNMVINTEENVQGFFGWVTGGGTTIKNLIIDKSCSIKGGDCTAGVIGKTTGYNNAPIYVLNCVNEAEITGDGAATGILGAQQSPYAHIIMHNCVNAGKVVSTRVLGANKCASAFIGWTGDIGIGKNCELWNCVNIAELTPIDEGKHDQLIRGSYRSWLNDYDVIYHFDPYQGVHNIWETEDPVASGELCWLLNQNWPQGTQGVSYKQTIGVDPYPLPIDDGQHYEVIKNDEGIFCNLDEDSIEQIPESQFGKDNVIYNLAGQRLVKMQKGINIVNGKKIFIR